MARGVNSVFESVCWSYVAVPSLPLLFLLYVAARRPEEQEDDEAGAAAAPAAAPGLTFGGWREAKNRCIRRDIVVKMWWLSHRNSTPPRGES